MKKIIFVVLLSFVSLNIFSQQDYHILYTVKGLANGNAYLAVCRGNIRIPVDTTTIVNGVIDFNKKKQLPVGVYRIIFKDSSFTDFVYNNEDVVMENQLPFLRANLKIVKSGETKIFYEYWNTSRQLKDSIDETIKIGEVIYRNNGGVFTSDLDSMQKRVVLLNNNLKSFTISLIEKSKGMFVQKLLKAYLAPDYEAYLKKPEAFQYKSRFSFLKDHYFDNVDFADTNLLNTEVFYQLANDYISTFSDPPTTESYIRTIGFVLGKASDNKPVFNYLLNLMMNTFETSDFEEVYVYLIDNYYLQSTCESGSGHKTIAAKAEALKKLKVGNSAPEIKMGDVNGNLTSLYSVKTKVVILHFWSSECQHCVANMPELIKIYNDYKPKGLEIFGVSIDTVKSLWIECISKNNLKWLNVSDLKGLKSEYICSYNIWHTPTFYLLNEEKAIIARPLSVEQLKVKLKEIFN
jgi:peroxiredoxin